MSAISFSIEKKIPHSLGRAGKITTPHGVIETPAYVTVGTKATVKSLTPEQLKEIGTQVVLANTYHLYLEPGPELIRDAGGLGKFMHWEGPTMTDSGGFQVFSLGAAFGRRLGKIGKSTKTPKAELSLQEEEKIPLAKINEDGVTFKSHSDGSTHVFTPERSIEIQHNIGADIIFAFDECTAPDASHEYQKEAMERTHRWAKRSLIEHKRGKSAQALFGIVQGGRFEDLRKESAETIGKMDFDGFGIGGSFEEEDLYKAVAWVNRELPEEKPRHLLGIGEPTDLFGAVESGSDTFDCVAPTRLARNGALYTTHGRINIFNAQFVKDFSPIDEGCACYTCTHYSRAYVAHLFRANEILANTLASIHNVYFVVNVTKKIRNSILDGSFFKLKEEFLGKYKRGE